MKNKNKQTKFPVARIKKIMQKNEEVGKVAQATPVVISKALELFLDMIVDEASKVTHERNSKRVEAYHLKHAVEQTEMLDFLREIVQSVPDPSAGGTIDLDGDDGDGRRRRGGPRKKKRKAGDADMEEEADGDEERTFVNMNKRAEASAEKADGANGHKGRWRVKPAASPDEEVE